MSQSTSFWAFFLSHGIQSHRLFLSHITADQEILDVNNKINTTGTEPCCWDVISYLVVGSLVDQYGNRLLTLPMKRNGAQL